MDQATETRIANGKDAIDPNEHDKGMTEDAASYIGHKAEDATLYAGHKTEDAAASVGSGLRSLGESVRSHGPEDGMAGAASTAVLIRWTVAAATPFRPF